MAPSILDQNYFEDLKSLAMRSLQPHLHLFLSLDGESSQFIRLNGAKVRQTGLVEDAQLSAILVSEADDKSLRKCSKSFTLSGDPKQDCAQLLKLLEDLEGEADRLPPDAFAEVPKAHASSRLEKRGNLLSPFEATEALLAPAKEIDLVGIYSSGTIVRAFANSAGLSHWFKSDSFLLDYSLYTPQQKALKGLLAGPNWDSAKYQKIVEGAKTKLKLLEIPPKKLSPGEYRVYLAPHAVSDLIQMFSWGGVSEAAIQQGDSPLRKLRNGSEKFSPLFDLSEDFRSGSVPRWSEDGELAPEFLALIEKGSLRNSLISSRTAKEYKLTSNAAPGGEGLRSPSVSAGTLLDSEILAKLDTGIFISNLHYLNWSDQPEGRITGMTRYACFWVENGKIVSPIENMRFDDTIFRIFGSELLALTKEREIIPETSTYGMRSLGASLLPGILISQMKFTL